MSEVKLSETSQSSGFSEVLPALKRLNLGEVLTVYMSESDDPDNLVSQARNVSRKWDFQKHRLGDNSWLLHAKLSR